MTQVERPRLKAAYRGVVYGIDVLDHVTNLVVPNDYVGQTRQRGRLRENQHRDTQPFSDRIVGSPHVLWEGICTDEELDEMERHFIQDVKVRPRLNEKMNEDNPHMISKGVQREQRWARDDENDRPRWQPPQLRDRSSLLEWNTPDRPAFERTAVRQNRVAWKPWQKRLTGWGCGWLSSTTAGWVAVLHWHVGGWGWRQAGIGSAAAVSVLAVWLACGAPVPVGKKRDRQRRARNLRKRLWS